MGLWEYPAFAVFGFVVGTYGTLVGLGGGFIVVPVLFLIYRADPQDTVGTSLAVIFLNAVSGSISYIRIKRVDLRSGTKFALATVPGAAIGAYVASYLTSWFLSLAFGILMVTVSVFMLWKPEFRPANGQEVTPLRDRLTTRRLIDADGNTFNYSFNERLGVIISVFVGFLSSILGIGGGVIHVPALIHLLAFPAHIATATSQFILVFTTGVGAASHLALGQVLLGPAIAMGAGTIAGAQLGAHLSRRLQSDWIVRLLSLALLLVGVRLLMAAIWK